MKIGVKILPRKEILDTQGRAVEKVLQHHNHSQISCRVGKYLELELEANTADEARKKVKEMADFVLYNPLIETYEIEVYEA